MKRMFKRSIRWTGLICVTVVAFAVLQINFGFGQGADVTIGEFVDPVEAEIKIAESLARNVDFRFEETPLEEVARKLSDALGCPVVLDQLSLDDVGIDRHTPITMNLSGVSLRAGLKFLLRDLEMSWTIHNEALVLTTFEGCESRLRVQLYDVTDLMSTPHSNKYYTSKLDGDASEIIKVISWTVSPDSWSNVGGPGSIQPLVVGSTTLIVVDQTIDVHTQISDFLRLLRSTVQQAEAEQDRRREQAEGGTDESLERGANEVDSKNVARIYRINASQDAIAEDYVDLIRLVIDRAEWDTREDVFVQAIASSVVVVRHEPAVQQAVAHLLTDAGVLRDPTQALWNGVTPVDSGAVDGAHVTPAGGLFGLRPSIR